MYAKRIPELLTLMAAVLIAAGAALATPMGTAFTYQGYLTTDTGPVHDTCDFRFTLYDCEGGYVAGPVTVMDISVEHGLFTIGDDDPGIDFGTDVFTGECRDMQIEVKCTGDADFVPFPDLQELMPAPHALALPGLWTQQNETSPNLIGGANTNTVTAGVIGGTISGGGATGRQGNTVYDDYGTIGGGAYNQAGSDDGDTTVSMGATVAGGGDNTASGIGDTVGGGFGNTASGGSSAVAGGEDNTTSASLAAIGGGSQNTANGWWAVVGGGLNNTATGTHSVVGGGTSNQATSVRSTVSGGELNDATGQFATIGGGTVNDASGYWSTVGGGANNEASANHSTVPGGSKNTAAGEYSLAAGRRAKANHDGAFVWGDSTDADFASTGADQFLIRAAGGVGIGTPSPAEQLDVEGNIHASGTITSDGSITIDGTTDTITSTGDLEFHVSSGRALRIEADATSPNIIGGFSGNTVDAGVVGATIAGAGESGSINHVTDDYGTIGGGGDNQAGNDDGDTSTATYATVGGGKSNIANGPYATVAGGYDNEAGLWSTVAGGRGNIASGQDSAVSGGDNNIANGERATVGGGLSNAATGRFATVDGGFNNSATGDYSTAGGGSVNVASAWRSSIGGGESNTASGQGATIGGGEQNSASGRGSTISGGEWNVASGLWSTVPGGLGNDAVGDASFAAGTLGRALDNGTFVWADTSGAGAAFESTGPNQFLIRAVGGVGIGTDSPSEQLDVEGNIHTSGTITSGSSITIDGTTNTITSSADLEFHVSSGRALRVEPAGPNGLGESSPNVIGGADGNTVISGVVGATIPGGGIIGGSVNQVAGDFGTVGGGAGNTTSGRMATVSGGGNNAATDTGATIAGGSNNSASFHDATVGGGFANTASGSNATVGGGFMNNATAGNATVGGGAGNTASGSYSTVGGGHGNEAAATYATIAGGGRSDPEDEATRNRVTDDYGTIGGGGDNQAGDADGITTDAPYATVSGGEGNRATDDHAAVAGGSNNTASAVKAVVSGGNNNVASAVSAAISGGEDNIADGVGAVVGGGFRNQALGIDSTVGGGSDNVTIGHLSTVAGGRYNTTSGFVSTAPGGIWNEAVGDYSFAAGRSAKADHHGMFVWADSDNAGPSDEDFPSATEPNFTPGPDQFLVRARGGVVFVSAIDGATGDSTAGVILPGGSGTWGSLSDRAAKANITPVDGREILRRLNEIPVSTWNYRSQDPSIRHIGPMAQDFHAAFGVGEDERFLPTVDADGVALAAIQGLHEIVKEKDAQIAAFEARLVALEEAIASMAQNDVQTGGAR